MIIISKTKNADDGNERVVKLESRNVVPIVRVNVDGGAGGIASDDAKGIEYPFTMASVITDPDSLKNYLVDTDELDRFTHVARVTSKVTGKLADIYHDNKERLLFALPDLNLFDTGDDTVDKNGSYILGFYSIGRLNRLNETVNSGNMTAQRINIKPVTTVSSKTHLLSVNAGLPTVQASSGGLMLSGETYLEGDFNVPVQIISLGNPNTLFGVDYTFDTYAMIPDDIVRYTFRAIGTRKLDDLCFMLNF